MIAFILFTGLGVWLKEGLSRHEIDPQALLEETLDNMNQAQSFRYAIKSQLLVGEKREVIGDILGERAANGAVHIKGEMVKTPVDIYYVDRVSYNYDPYSRRWLEVDDAASNVSQVLITELNPLSNFNFKSVSEVSFLGYEKVNGQPCAVIACSASLENELMEVYWENFRYRLWCDTHKRLLRKAQISAVSKHNPNTRLDLEVKFSDIGKPITIKKPVP